MSTLPRSKNSLQHANMIQNLDFLPTMQPNNSFEQPCYAQPQMQANMHVPAYAPPMQLQPFTLQFPPISPPILDPMTGTHLVAVYSFPLVNVTPATFPPIPVSPLGGQVFTFPEMNSLSSNSSDLYDSPSPNGSILDSGSEREIETVQTRLDINAKLDAIAERLVITPETINGVILDHNRYQSNYSELVSVPYDPIVSFDLRPEMIYPDGHSFKLSFETFRSINSFDGLHIHICAEINGVHVTAKMRCLENSEHVSVFFASEAERFEFIPGSTVYVVSSDVETNVFKCQQPGLRLGLLVTDENQVVRGTLRQPYCEQVIIQSQKALMLSPILISKFVNENKEDIIRYHLVYITDASKNRVNTNVGFRLFMHLRSEGSRERFKAMLRRFPHLSKSTTQLYKADKNLERAVEYHQQILQQGDGYLLDSKFMHKWSDMDLQSPKTAQQMLAYFARLGGIFPISDRYLTNTKHFELSLKYLKEERRVPSPNRFAYRCSIALRAAIELIGTEGDEATPGSKILKKTKGATKKVVDRIPAQRAKHIQRINFRTHSAQDIKEECCRTYLSNRRVSSRTVYWKQRNPDGTLEYKTKIKALRSAVNELENFENQRNKRRVKSIMKPVRHNLSQEDFKTFYKGEMVCPFLLADGSGLDERALKEAGMKMIFQRCEVSESEQERFALLFEDMQNSEMRKLQEKRVKQQSKPQKATTDDYADEHVTVDDFWNLLFHQRY